MNADRVVLFLCDVDARVIGKFFRLAADGRINRNAACREAELIEFADGAEIRGAEKRHPIILPPVELAVTRFLKTKAGETGARR